ncbi:MAG: S-methyl-5-thioribose-1-phosphate isomerase, partial [Thermoanaerobaculia bacterium]|nr:S-methyl-5-thioribose-1-phosphate isomerase [Thermoanaerobaculia bacterium]
MDDTAPPSRVFSPIRWVDDHLELLEQTLLPRQEVWLPCRRPEEVADAIYRLAVRGAPAIGVAAAYGLVLGLQTAGDTPLAARSEGVAAPLGATRPTAVHGGGALGRGRVVRARHRDEPHERV